MPAPATVTPADISGAAATLQAAGEQITGWRLRRVLGRGRPDRLEAIWREQQAEAAPTPAPEPEAPPLPPAISEHLAAAEERALADVRGLVAAAWRLAADLAARRVADEIRDARGRVAVLEAELTEAGRAVEAADERGAMLEQDLGAARQAAASAEAALAEARTEAERAAAAAAARQEAATQEAGRLRDELAAARRTIEEARGAVAAAEARTAAVTRAAEEARAERDAARQEAAQARAEVRNIEGIAAKEGARAEAAERRAAEAEQRAQAAEEARRTTADQLTQAIVRAEVATASAQAHEQQAEFWRQQARADLPASPPETESRPAETASHDATRPPEAPAGAPAPSRRGRPSR